LVFIVSAMPARSENTLIRSLHYYLLSFIFSIYYLESELS
jgi:hypothetical protein